MKINLFIKAKITGEELQQCLAYYEAENRILAFQTKEADLFNNTMVKYSESITKDADAAHEMCNASIRRVQSIYEVLRRHEEINPVPEAASSMHYAWYMTFLAVATWAEATSSATEAISNGMKPHLAYIQHLVDEYQTAWRKAQKEDRKFLRSLKITPDIIEKIIRRCSEAAKADCWQPKSVNFKSQSEEVAPYKTTHSNSTKEKTSENLKNAQAYCASGDAHRRKLEQDLAIADYTKAIEIAPKFAKAYHDRGRAYRAKDEYDLAIRDFTKAIEIGEKSDVGYMERGHAYTDKGEYEPAIADYTKVIEANPSFVGGYYYRAQAYIRKGEYERAKLDFNKVIEIQPNTVLRQAAHYNLSCIYMKRGDKDSAMEHYEALKKLDEEPANMLLDRIKNMAESFSKTTR
jgi:tetratricopeptide (TPR) repeat protein